ncbi:cytochrome P450 4V2-like [Oppia nitens]|uniref:cytochrome P450 4V2-like n=1 Tax=Oppia nitens TaxID=1686743 RepID=UPI0023DC3313|nr:cytochrome P450 4V2-like [Oppia nitens]
MISLTIFSVIIIIIIYFYYKLKNLYRDRCLSTIPGPRHRYPFIGNLDLFRIPGVPRNEIIYKILLSLCNQYNKYGIYKIFLGPKPVVVIFKSKLMNTIFSSHVNIEKSYIYKFLSVLCLDGLAMSTGSKWKGRRKLLTPAFHFKILNNFIPIMNEQTNIFMDKIRNQLAIDRQSVIDIREPITLLTLDIICETAMGVQVGAQVGNNRSYIGAVHDFEQMFMKRIFSPWLWSDRLFYWTPMGRKFSESLDTLHSFTRNVINQKKQQLLIVNNNNNDTKSLDSNDNNNDNYFMNKKKKKSMAFMDLLLDYHLKDNHQLLFTVEDINEEVNMFMYAGHDTIAVSLGWTLYLIGLHPRVQDKIEDELTTIFGSADDHQNNINRDITSEDIQRMSYLDCVLKESLRMYPSAPFVARRLVEECVVSGDDGDDDYVIPAGVDVFIMIRQMHYDSDVFAKPDHFIPERFQCESSQINAYNYIPFSAGPRNCIGKRFAVIEEMIVLSKILLNFTIESMEPLDSVQTAAEIVYCAKSP